jgi:hypothetical protein
MDEDPWIDSTRQNKILGIVEGNKGFFLIMGETCDISLGVTHGKKIC